MRTTSHCGVCVTGRATIVLIARRPDLYRAIAACPADQAKARTWTARAGPPAQIPDPDEQEPTTLF